MKLNRVILARLKPDGSMFPVKTITVSSKGQFTLPKAERERLGLTPGDQVCLEVLGKELWIRPQHAIRQETAGSRALSDRRRKGAVRQ